MQSKESMYRRFNTKPSRNRRHRVKERQDARPTKAYIGDTFQNEDIAGDFSGADDESIDSVIQRLLSMLQQVDSTFAPVLDTTTQQGKLTAGVVFAALLVPRTRSKLLDIARRATTVPTIIVERFVTVVYVTNRALSFLLNLIAFSAQQCAKQNAAAFKTAKFALLKNREDPLFQAVKQCIDRMLDDPNVTAESTIRCIRQLICDTYSRPDEALQRLVILSESLTAMQRKFQDSTYQAPNLDAARRKILHNATTLYMLLVGEIVGALYMLYSYVQTQLPYLSDRYREAQYELEAVAANVQGFQEHKAMMNEHMSLAWECFFETGFAGAKGMVAAIFTFISIMHLLMKVGSFVRTTLHVHRTALPLHSPTTKKQRQRVKKPRKSKTKLQKKRPYLIYNKLTSIHHWIEGVLQRPLVRRDYETMVGIADHMFDNTSDAYFAVFLEHPTVLFAVSEKETIADLFLWLYQFYVQHFGDDAYKETGMKNVPSVYRYLMNSKADLIKYHMVHEMHIKPTKTKTAMSEHAWVKSIVDPIITKSKPKKESFIGKWARRLGVAAAWSISAGTMLGTGKIISDVIVPTEKQQIDITNAAMAQYEHDRRAAEQRKRVAEQNYEYGIRETSKQGKDDAQKRKKQLQKRMDPYMRATGSGHLSQNTVRAFNEMLSKVSKDTQVFALFAQHQNSTPRDIAAKRDYQPNGASKSTDYSLSQRQAIQNMIRKSLQVLNINHSLDDMIGVYQLFVRKMANFHGQVVDTSNSTQPVAYPKNQAVTGLGGTPITRSGKSRAKLSDKVLENAWHTDGIVGLHTVGGAEAQQILRAVANDDGTFDKQRFYKRFVHVVAFWTPDGYVTILNGDLQLHKQSQDQSFFSAQFGNAPHGFRTDGSDKGRGLIRVEFMGVIVDKTTEKDLERHLGWKSFSDDFETQMMKAMRKHHERRLG